MGFTKAVCSRATKGIVVMDQPTDRQDDESPVRCSGNNCGWQGWARAQQRFGLVTMWPERCPECGAELEEGHDD
jgi:hypothetical protein